MRRRAMEPEGNRFTVSVLASLLLAVAVSASASASAPSPSAPPPLRTLVHVETAGSGGNEVLVLVTDGPPNFTSFKRSTPSSVVIDFPETRTAPTVLRQAPGVNGGVDDWDGDPGSDVGSRAVAGVGLAVGSNGGGEDDGPSAIAGWSIHAVDDSLRPATRVVVAIREDRDFTLHVDGNALTLRTVPRIARPLVALVNPRFPGEGDEAPDEGVVLVQAESGSETGAGIGMVESEGVVEATQQVVERTANDVEGSSSASSPVASLPSPATPSRDRIPPPRSPDEEMEEREPLLTGIGESGKAATVGATPKHGAVSRGELVAVERVLFRKTESGAQLSVRTAAPVGYSLRETSSRGLVLELKGAHIPLSTNRLPLDTRFFGTFVSRVVPRVDSARGQVSIHVELSDDAAYRAYRDDSGLIVDFLPPRSDLSAGLVRTGGGRP